MVRLLSIFGQFLAAVVAVAAAAWWIATIGMRLSIRGLERWWPLRQGGLAACCTVLIALCLSAAVSVSVVAALLVWLLAPAAGGTASPWPPWLLDSWNDVLTVAAGLAILSGVVAAASEASAAWGAVRRRRHLQDLHRPPIDAVKKHPPLEPGRRIVILCDGTSNRPDQKEDGLAAATNVWKLSEALHQDETQTVWYQAGIGSDTSSTARQAARTRVLLSVAGASAGVKIAAWASRF